MPASDKKLPDPFSKSELKRKMHNYEEIGKQLIALAASQLKMIPLPENVLEAIHLAHTLKTHGAKKRHLQYMGKLLRDVEIEPVQTALMKLKMVLKKDVTQFHAVEEWRDNLIVNGDGALQKLSSMYPDIDRQQVRRLMLKAKHDRKEDKNSGAETELFRYLKKLMDS